MRVRQRCIWKFLIFQGTFQMTVGVTESPATTSLRFSLLDSKFMKSFEGGWRVEPTAPGACRVTYEAEIGPSVAPPRAFASYTRKIFVRQTEVVFEDLEAELMRRLPPV